ncbi:hypothetical protein ACOMHN_003462 [Nucella lapillus]
MMTCVVLSEGGGGGVKLTPEAVDSYTRIVCYTRWWWWGQADPRGRGLLHEDRVLHVLCQMMMCVVLSDGGGGGVKLTPEAVDCYTRIVCYTCCVR